MDFTTIMYTKTLYDHEIYNNFVIIWLYGYFNSTI